MEAQVDRLVEKAWNKYQQTPESQRLIIGIAGIPGSGKTTLAATVVKNLNARHHSSSPNNETPIAAFVPMDGYHLSRAQLSAMPDPDTAHARRGAAFTFDASSFHSLMQSLRQPITPSSRTIHAPSFSHATKDPVADDIPIPPTCRIVVTEGNYIALDEGEWKKARGCMDEVWFVEVEERVARARLVKRHIVAGLASNEEEAAKRADENDLVNGREIVEKRGRVDEVIHSREDAGWKPQRQEP